MEPARVVLLDDEARELVAGRPLVRGALIGVGAMIKVWPIMLLVGVRRWRELIVTTLGAAAVIVATTLAIGATLPGSSMPRLGS